MERSYYPLDPDPTIPGLCLTYQVSDSQERESSGSSLGHMLPISPDLVFVVFTRQSRVADRDILVGFKKKYRSFFHSTML